MGAILNLPANKLFYIFYWVDNGQWTCEDGFFQNNWPPWADEPNKLWDIWGISS